MIFGYTVLYVNDVSKSIDFYVQAFGLEKRFLHESGQYGEMETGQTALGFAAIDLAKENVPGGFTLNSRNNLPPALEISFIVEDVQKAFDQAIAQGALSVLAPIKKEWGQTVSYVKDLDGVLVGLVSAI